MAELPAIGAVVAGKYRIEALLGEGGMGAVFRARHELMDKEVALKLLHPSLARSAEAAERFLREARAAARIRHPNVVDVQDVGQHEGSLFMVMELLTGESFDSLLARPDVPLSRALRLLIEAMRGVEAAHQRGIVHRDIKPENIFVVESARAPDGSAKVLDFGISKLTDPGSKSLTQTGSTMGTPAYMSVEQMNGARDVDVRADVYAFGVLLYRALTGRLPFDGDSFAAIAVQVATHHPPAPSALRPELPAGLDAVVTRAMARDREQRYASMSDLISALQPFTEGAPQPAGAWAVKPAPAGRTVVEARSATPVRGTEPAGPLSQLGLGPSISGPSDSFAVSRTQRSASRARLAGWAAALLTLCLGGAFWWKGGAESSKPPQSSAPPPPPRPADKVEAPPESVGADWETPVRAVEEVHRAPLAPTPEALPDAPAVAPKSAAANRSSTAPSPRIPATLSSHPHVAAAQPERSPARDPLVRTQSDAGAAPPAARGLRSGVMRRDDF